MKTTRLLAYLLSGSVLVGAGACGNNKPLLTRASAADPSACATGGTVIQTGEDKNQNGILEDTEVTQTTPVCNGTVTTGPTGQNGKTPLIQSSALPPGNTACPSGGSKLEIGYDDGSGGGTAGDGILQSGEVTSSKTVCSFGQTPHVGSLTPPEGPAGAFTIQSLGGDGVNGAGAGGSINIHMSNGSLGGHLKLFNNGTVDTTPVTPPVTFDAGTNPVVIDTDTTLNVYTDDNAAIASGDPVFIVGDIPHFLRTNIDDESVPATSLDIAAGVTFTVSSPYFAGGATYYSWFFVEGDIRNAGTIRFAPIPSDGKSAATYVYLNANNYYGLAGSLVDMGGKDVPGGLGGNGANGWAQIYMRQALINDGEFRFDAGSGNTVGNPNNQAYVGSQTFTVNTGNVHNNGGTAATGVGGSAGTIYFGGGYKSFYNSGTIEASGGNGVLGSGSGGQASLSCTSGVLKLTGSLLAKGGTCSSANCPGGQGGQIYLSAYGGPLSTTARLDSSGGAGKGTGNGGGGGSINVYAGAGEGANGDADRPAVSAHVSGNMLAQGGTGSFGGQGGDIDINLGVGTAALGQELTLLGYSAIKAMGGTATVGNGGGGGAISVYQDPSYPDSDGDIAAPAGSVLNYVDLTAKGGNGGTGNNAGGGGSINVRTQTSYYFGADFERVINRGHLLVQGGDATRVGGFGGYGGTIYLTGISGVDNQGQVSSLGGGVTATGGFSGSAGEIYLRSDYGPLMNAALVECNGGSDTLVGGTGGTGGNIYLYGVGVTSTDMLSATGGSGGGTTTGFGGSGGYIWGVSSPPGAGASASYDVSGGTGITSNGTKGNAYADGVDVTP